MFLCLRSLWLKSKPNAHSMLIMNKAVLSRLERIAVATAAKFSEKSVIKQEYEGELEQVGPAPGKPWDQHDTMVREERENF